jgi:serine/threonine-protein kinase
VKDTSHPTDGHALLDRALAIDPKFAWPLVWRALLRLDVGDLDGALAAVDECLRVSPAAATCLRRRSQVHARRGACKELLDDARSMVAIEPNGTSAYEFLSQALTATGAPPESIREAARKSRELAYDPHAKEALELTEPIIVPFLAGDAATMVARFSEWEKFAATSSSDEVVGDVVEYQARIFEEMGEGDRAVPILLAYLNRLPALTQDSPFGARHVALPALKRKGRLAGAAFEAKRDEWVATAMAKLGPRRAWFAWLLFYADAARTAEEAKEALAALPRFVVTPYDGELGQEARMGRVLWLAGRADEAEPHLRRALAACPAWHELLVRLRAALALGELLEAKGDKPGACAAYGEVLARWGHAKPRSITADEARAHAAKLACGDAKPASGAP